MVVFVSGTEVGRTDELFIVSLATVLTHLVSLSPVDRGQITRFHAIKAPDISIRDYLVRIQKYFGCANECFVLALVYIDRIVKFHKEFKVSVLNVHRLLITAVVLAAKFFDDVYYSNAFYARVGGVRTKEINLLEWQFLSLVQYRLFVAPREYDQYRKNVLAAVHAGIQRPITMQQPCSAKPPPCCITPTYKSSPTHNSSIPGFTGATQAHIKSAYHEGTAVSSVFENQKDWGSTMSEIQHTLAAVDVLNKDQKNYPPSLEASRMTTEAWTEEDSKEPNYNSSCEISLLKTTSPSTINDASIGNNQNSKNFVESSLSDSATALSRAAKQAELIRSFVPNLPAYIPAQHQRIVSCNNQDHHCEHEKKECSESSPFISMSRSHDKFDTINPTTPQAIFFERQIDSRGELDKSGINNSINGCVAIRGIPKPSTESADLTTVTFNSQANTISSNIKDGRHLTSSNKPCDSKQQQQPPIFLFAASSQPYCHATARSAVQTLSGATQPLASHLLVCHEALNPQIDMWGNPQKLINHQSMSCASHNGASAATPAAPDTTDPRLIIGNASGSLIQNDCGIDQECCPHCSDSCAGINAG